MIPDRGIVSSVADPGGLLTAIPAMPVIGTSGCIGITGRSGPGGLAGAGSPGKMSELVMHEMFEVALSVQCDLSRGLWESLDSPAATVNWTNWVAPPGASPPVDRIELDYSSPIDVSVTKMSRLLRHRVNMIGLLSVEWEIFMSPATWRYMASNWPTPWLMAQAQRKREWECSFCGSAREEHENKCRLGCGGERNTGWICLYCGRSYSEEGAICWDGEDGCGAISAMTRVADVSGLNEVAGGEFTQWMFSEKKVPIDGFLYNVHIDPALSQENNVWFLPLRVGGTHGMTREWASARDADVCPPRSARGAYWSDDGEYLWTTERRQFSYSVQCSTWQKITTQYPYLIGKLSPRR